jgi:hypothetical protein
LGWGGVNSKAVVNIPSVIPGCSHAFDFGVNVFVTIFPKSILTGAWELFSAIMGGREANTLFGGNLSGKDLLRNK